MKKFLSMALALIMVLTMVSGLTVAVSAADYVDGDIIVYWNKFEDSSVYGHGNIFGYSIATEEDGNKFLKLSVTDESKVRALATMSGNFNDQTRARVNTASSANLTLKSGLTYSYSYDIIANESGSYLSQPGHDYTTFYDSDSTAVFASWSVGGKKSNSRGDGTNWHTVNLGSKAINAVDASGNALATYTVGSYFFKVAPFSNTIGASLTKYKAYSGAGLTAYDGTASYTLSEDEVCTADTEKTSAKTYTYYNNATIEDVDSATDAACTCSDENCPRKVAVDNFVQEVMDKNLWLGLDNFIVKTAGKYYSNDTVTVGNGGSVSVVANPATAETVALTAGDNTVTVNDYFDVVYNLTPADGYEAYAVVDGEAAEIVDNEFTVSVEEAATANEIVIGFAKESSTVTRTKTVTFDGGNLSFTTEDTSSDKYYAPAYTSADGVLYVYDYKKDGNVGLVDAGVNEAGEEYISYVPYPHENHGAPRASVTIGGNKNWNFATDRTYTIAFDVQNTSAAATNAFDYVQWEATTWTSFDTGATTSAKYAGYDSYNMRQSIPAGARTSNAKTISFSAVGTDTTDVYGALKMTVVPQGGSAGDAFRVFRMYGVTLTETVKVHPVVANVGEGTIIASTNSLNFPESNIANEELTNGESIDVEDNMPLTFSVVAPQDMIVDTVKYSAGGVETDVEKNDEGQYEIASVKTSSEILVTYKDNPAAIQSTYDYITLSANKTLYVSGEAMAAQYPIVLAYKEGVAYDVTGSKYVTIESDNDLVFKAENGTLATTDKFGFATITATYDNLEGEDVSATVMYQRSENSKAAGNPGSTYVVENTSGHVEGSSAYSYAHVENYNGYGCRISFGTPRGLDWNTHPWRTMVAWFYDAGVEDQTENAQLWPFVKYYDAATGKYFTNQSGNLGVDVNNKTSYIPNRLNAVPRSKGWHQAMVTVNKSGQILKYIDGILVDQINVVVGTWSGSGTAPESNLEFRCSGNGMYSDFAVTDYVGTKENYAVTLDATNGTISGDATVAYGETAEYTLTAAEGYDIPETVEVYDYAGLNTQTLTVTGGKFSLTPSDDTIIKAVFTEKVATAPVVKNNTATDTGAYNKTITGIDGNPVAIAATKSVTAYATVDAGFGYTVGEYGIELKKGDKVVALKAVGSEYEGSYAIVAYGAAIVAGDYSVRAYVKYTDADGAAQVVYGDWSSVTIK